MAPTLSVALQYVHAVQAKLTGVDRRTYDQFFRTLKLFRNWNINSSMVVSTVQTLFQNHPDLLDAFNPFIPRNISAADAAPTADESSLRDSVDFLNRVRIRFHGGRVYSNFLNCMRAYSRKEMSGSDVFDKVVGLFGKNDDLVDEFKGFLPESCVRERTSSKRRIDQTDLDREFGLQKQWKRRRGSNSNNSNSNSNSNSGSNDDQDTAVAQRRTMKKCSDEEKAVQRIKDRDNDMEDSLYEVDVRIGNLESSRRSAKNLSDLLSDGRVAVADVRLDEHFTPLNFACIRRLDRKLLDFMDQDVVHALPALIESLMKRKEGLEKERVKIEQKWNKVRQSS